MRGLSDFGDIAAFQNWLKKFRQVGIDVTCIHTNFGGRGLSSFGDIATFKNSQFSLSV